MLGPRWRKVLRDLWGAKMRTALVVLSIAVGVFAVGMIASTREMLARELAADYQASNPSSALLITDPVDDELIRSIRNVHGVREAQGRAWATVRAQMAPGRWANLQLEALVDYRDMRLDRVEPELGTWPPAEHELVLERASAAYLGARLGDVVTVETPGGKQRRMRVAGIAHDVSRASPLFGGAAYGYVTRGTIDWLGGPQGFQLGFAVAERPLDAGHIRLVGEQVRNRVERSGAVVHYLQVPTNPGEHPINTLIQPVMLVLGVLAALSLLLSSFLVMNTISALLAQQVRQIGIMKAIGAREHQIATLYLGMVLVYGLLALVVAVPLGALGAQALTRLLASFVNADVANDRIPPAVLALQAFVALIVPALAALYPVAGGIRVTVREAVASYGLGGRPAASALDRLLERAQGLSRPLLLSLRNTFRRRGRLALTLATLTLAGAMFIAVFSVRASLLRTVNETLTVNRFDSSLALDEACRMQEVTEAARAVPGVVRIEGQMFATVRRVRPDGSESNNVYMQGLAPETRLFRPTLVQGRWLDPADGNALVINTDLARDDPDVGVGSDIVLKYGGRETTWRVVGIVKATLMSVPPVPWVYANLPAMGRATREPGRVNRLSVEGVQHDPASQMAMGEALEARLKAAGVPVSFTESAGEVRARIMAIFDMLVALLLIMAILLAVVGGLGLMGTMGLNVLERRREIGVMRAIGASDGAIRGVIVVEGITVGVLSWLAGALLALPMSKLLSDGVGLALLKMPLAYTYAPGGVAAWLAVVVALGAVASLAPARSASRLTVSQVLAYE